MRRMRRLSIVLIIAGLALLAVPPAQWATAAYRQKQLEQKFLRGGSLPSAPAPKVDDFSAWESGETDGEVHPDAIQNRFTDQVLGYFWEDPALEIPAELKEWAELNQPSPEFLANFPGALIRIPAIKAHAIVLYGTSLRTLAQGPGFYEVGALPGDGGNVAIAGHRTTYGAWFRNVDQLDDGDLIELIYRGVEYHYAVERVWVIEANDWSVVAPTETPSLTLTACHPPGSAAYRMAVRARLVKVDDPDSRPPTPDIPA